MKLYITYSQRSRLFEIDGHATLEDLQLEVVKVGLFPGVYAFKIFYNGNEVKSGPLSDSAIRDGSHLHAVHSLEAPFDLLIKSQDNTSFYMEVFPDIKIDSIKSRYFSKMGINPENNFLILNAQLLDSEKELREYLRYPTDVMYCITPPTDIQGVAVYITFGSDLLMLVEIPPNGQCRDVASEIERVYHIPATNQVLRWGTTMLFDTDNIEALAPDDAFILLTLELTGTLEATLKIQNQVVAAKFPADTTIQVIKTELLARKAITPESHCLRFEGEVVDNTDCLYSFSRVSVNFTLDDEAHDETLKHVTETIKNPADTKAEASLLYLYASLLVNGKVIPPDLAESANYYQKAVDKGHFSAMNDFAELMHSGVLKEPSPGTAQILAKRAADAGHVGALNLIAKIYRRAGKVQDSIRYLKLAADRGHVEAQTTYAIMILKGTADTTEIGKAQKLLQQCSALGYPTAMRTFGKLLIKQGERVEGQAMMEKAAKFGSSGATFYLATQAIAQNRIMEAVMYTTDAINLGHIGAKSLMGVMLRRGRGIHEDLPAAYKMLSEAADAGDTGAMYHCAKMLLKGDGCEKNEQMAVKRLRDAADARHVPSICLLSNLYARGIAVEKNPQLAFEAAMTAAERGSLKGIRMVAVMERDGFGCPQNIEEAMRNFEKAAKKDPLAMYHYACMLMKSTIYPQNRSTVIQYLQNAAETNLAIAQEQLGLLLLENDKVEAMRYFRLAANAGLNESKFQLALLMHEFEENDQEAANLLEAVANEGHSLGIYHYAVCLETGRGVEAQPELAREKFQKAADLGVALAQLKLGKILYSEAKINDATDYLRKAAQQDLTEAMLVLVSILSDLDPTANEPEILEMLTRAANLGDPEGMVQAASILERQNKMYEAFQYYKGAALRGRPDAMFHYAHMMQKALGTIQEPAEAAKYFRFACDAEYIPALYRMGLCYEMGDGVDQSYMNAITYYQMAADKEDPDGMVGLGRLYVNGFGVDKNPEEAAALFKKAVDRGHVEGHYQYALLFEHGNGVTRDMEESFRLFKFAAEKDYPPAMVFYGRKMLKGEHCQKDLVKGREILEKAAIFKEKDALFELAELFYSQQDLAKALRFYEEAAELGHTEAMTDAAELLEKDEDTLPRAIEFYQQAAEAGNMIAALNYGLALAQGRGTIRDQTMATKYLREAADSGIVEAMFNCGVLMMTAKGSAKNLSDARSMLRNAAEKGHIPSMYNLGTLMMTTEPIDVDSGLSMMKMAADKGCIDAIATYAYYIMLNAKDRATEEIAVRYVMKGVDLKDPRCYVMYGTLYYNGKGVIKSDSNAAKYYQMASEANDPDGLYSYGMMLLRGLGVTKDAEAARDCFKKAVALGHEGALTQLEQD